MSKNAHLLFAIASNSHLSISITLHCVSTIAYTFVDCCTSTCSSMNSYTSTSTTFSSPISFCIAYASTKCYSIASSSKGMGSSNLRWDIFICNGFFWFEGGDFVFPLQQMPQVFMPCKASIVGLYPTHEYPF
jgi:hypothetical protein